MKDSERANGTQPFGEGDEPQLDASDAAQRRTLSLVLVINLIQAAAVGVVGIAADSTGLLAAALDNLADGGVYAVSLYAAGKTVVAKARAARLSGVLLIVLGLVLLGEVIRRFMSGAEPIGGAMVVTAIANAAANLLCLRLLRSHRDEGVHLKASWIFTTNDMLANAGVAVSGIAVMLWKSPLPDLAIGLVVVGIGIRGGWEILKQARGARRDEGAGELTRRDEQR